MIQSNQQVGFSLNFNSDMPWRRSYVAFKSRGPLPADQGWDELFGKAEAIQSERVGASAHEPATPSPDRPRERPSELTPDR